VTSTERSVSHLLFPLQV